MLTVLSLAGLSVASDNSLKEIHFKMGRGSAVTYATGPEKIVSESNKNFVLGRYGYPVFFASSPEGKEGGSILFTPENGYYHTGERWALDNDNFALEVWVKPLYPEDKHLLDAKHLFGVVSLGDGRNGYNIIQQSDNWLVLVGGIGMFEFGPATFNQWTHLALVADGIDLTLWMNGIESGTFSRTQNINPGFTVGNISQGNNQFNGEIYEVRYKTFKEGQFDPNNDFLLNYKIIEETREHVAVSQKKRIERINRNQTGVVLTDNYVESAVEADYLIRPVDRNTQLYIVKKADGAAADMVLTNGLISRTFYVSENIASISFKNLANGAEYLRATKPETRIKINDRWIEVGGLTGQPEKSYLLPEWLPQLQSNPNSWVLKDITTRKPEPRYPWEQKYNARQAEWPPKGLQLIMHFEAPETEIELHGIDINVHYEMYDGIPVIAKWVTIDNGSGNDIVVEETETEVLAINQDQVDRIHVESDYSFALVNASPKGSVLMHFSDDPKPYQAGESTTTWELDPEYTSWASHNPAEDNFLGLRHYNLLKSRLPMGPSALLKAGDNFNSFITFELLLDSDDRERNSLAQRRLYRTLAPQVTESLLTAAITSHDTQVLKNMIDQMAELGFERLDIHPWPGIAHDNLDPEYIKHWKEIADYAAKHDIIMGGYELVIASRGRGAEYDCIHPETGKPGSLFGQSVCIASEWSDNYFSNTFKFMEKTGFMSWNADGPYHGDPCASEVHKYHRGLQDSQWEQWKKQVAVLHEFQKRNFYLPIPDWYFLNGQSSTGMGYREDTANLSPQQQLLLGRQYIYDGTWHKIPTMGWMVMQLVGFYTRDARVGLEPLKDNLDQYERGLVQHLGSGCQFILRGDRLYDTPETKAMVKKWTDWFLKYREVLTGDIIHLGRPTGRDLDFIMHVNPFGKDKGMVIIFNPTDELIRKKIALPLYYTGLDNEAIISEKAKEPVNYKLDRHYNVYIDVEVEANGFNWFLIQ